MTPPTDQHPETALFDAWITGALDADEAVAFEAHVHGCAQCARRLEQAAQLFEQMEGLAHELVEDGVFDARDSEGDAVDPAAEALPDAVSAPPPAPPAANRPWWILGLMAAAMALFAVVPRGPDSAALPSYGAVEIRGQATVRGDEPPPAASARTTPRGGFSITLRAEGAAPDAPLDARLWLVDNGALVPVEAAIDVAESGSVRARVAQVSGALAQPGEKRLVLGVSAAGEPLDDADVAQAVAGGAASEGWRFAAMTLTVEP